MRFLVLVKASEESEKGALPKFEEMDEMGKFNEQLVEAGVMLSADGLRSSKEGVRVRFAGGIKSVTNGPFGGTPSDLVAGYWVWQTKSKEEAVDWLKRAPFKKGETVEIRQIQEMSDFNEIDPSGDLMRREQVMREKSEANAKH